MDGRPGLERWQGWRGGRVEGVEGWRGLERWKDGGGWRGGSTKEDWFCLPNITAVESNDSIAIANHASDIKHTTIPILDVDRLAAAQESRHGEERLARYSQVNVCLLGACVCDLFCT